MKKHMGMFLLAMLVVAALLVSTVTYQLEFTEYGLIKRFGKTVSDFDGSTDAGLKFKWPWPVERLVKYDARTNVLEETLEELETRDRNNVLVTLYCAWKIADPVKFHAKTERFDKAEKQLRTLLRSEKKVIGMYNMQDLINTNPKAMRIPEIERDIYQRVQERAREDYGIQIVRVGIKSLGLPEFVSEQVITNMKGEFRP
ncbi:unnamed protein product, partial [marine sediment metagenome]